MSDICSLRYRLLSSCFDAKQALTNTINMKWNTKAQFTTDELILIAHCIKCAIAESQELIKKDLSVLTAKFVIEQATKLRDKLEVEERNKYCVVAKNPTGDRFHKYISASSTEELVSTFYNLVFSEQVMKDFFNDNFVYLVETEITHFDQKKF